MAEGMLVDNPRTLTGRRSLPRSPMTGARTRL
jgi:hypothetical protein